MTTPPPRRRNLQTKGHSPAGHESAQCSAPCSPLRALDSAPHSVPILTAGRFSTDCSRSLTLYSRHTHRSQLELYKRGCNPTNTKACTTSHPASLRLKLTVQRPELPSLSQQAIPKKRIDKTRCQISAFKSSLESLESEDCKPTVSRSYLASLKGHLSGTHARAMTM